MERHSADTPIRPTPYDAVLFIGFGGPEKSDDIMPFLELVTRGRAIPKERLEDVAHHYEALGGKSPINEITRRQADALRRQLKAQGAALKVYLGQRNWHPFLEDALRQMAEDGIQHALGFPAAAYRCEASWERYLNAVSDARKKIGPTAPAIDYVGPWFDHPLFIEAISEGIRETVPLSGLRPPSPASPREKAGLTLAQRELGEGARRAGEGTWIFTAHSIPIPMAASSRYVQELGRTAQLIAQRFGQTAWKLAYSSRSGRPQDPWLEPDVSEIILEEANRGIREILLIPIGFIADHVEVLYDLDVEAKATADKAGVRLLRARTVGDHPLFVRMMADVIEKSAAVRPA